MAARKAHKELTEDPAQVRDRWLARLGTLIDRVESWARELDWSTRRITKKMEESTVGTFRAPALLMQKETARVLLDPIAISTPGSNGLVDLYLMPAYDDIACLFFTNGDWQLHYPFIGSPVAKPNSKERREPLTKEWLGQVLDEIVQHAAWPV
jgi:hypothetical protein